MISGMLRLCVALGLICSAACVSYSPILYPSYDVLNPGEAVRLNPVGFISFDTDGDPDIQLNVPVQPGEEFTIVNEAYAQSYGELRAEILKLRKALEKQK